MRGYRYKLRRATCPSCQRIFGVRPPAGGDGSADVFPRHNARINAFGPRNEQPRCEWSRRIVGGNDYLVSPSAESGDGE